MVAADKGTAAFSDYANQVSQEYGHWLGDAFASGGSVGYDHKAMGITARGAWESVKRHFRELGLDTQASDFTVVGIGDMSGDVFGNGMLLSPHIRLVAAFDHRHVFIDPQPDAAAALAERKRLFELPRSSWADYDLNLVSEGGGIWARSEKSVPVSPQARGVLGIAAERLTPAELVSAILKAPVDLLYNGGIGTYVKASAETQLDVGDRANDAVRIDGAELRCRVVGEGGNLGFTQRGRIEAALAGVRLYTDAIDNSAGVDTSDHEVNIKILLGLAVDEGRLTQQQRNALLPTMTQDVAALVLRDNYFQTQALSVGRRLAAGRSTTRPASCGTSKRSGGWTGPSSSCPRTMNSPSARHMAWAWPRPSRPCCWHTARCGCPTSCWRRTCPRTPGSPRPCSGTSPAHCKAPSATTSRATRCAARSSPRTCSTAWSTVSDRPSCIACRS